MAQVRVERQDAVTVVTSDRPERRTAHDSQTAAARAALISPAATRGVSYEEPAALQVVEGSAGYPYFIQEYGLELWNYAETSPITSADVEAVREIVTDSLARSFFGTRFQRRAIESFDLLAIVGRECQMKMRRLLVGLV